jgi:ribosome-associated protein
LTSHELARHIAELALEKRGEDVVVIELLELTTIADYFVLVTGSVDVHLRAIAEHIQRSLRELEEPVRPVHVEGLRHLNWVLLDFGDVVVHLFQPETRAFYRLEGLWGDAPLERFEDENPSNVY